MSENPKLQHFIFKTSGVCPPEIHFRIQQEILNDIRFVGGGCPGNAQLVARLLRGRPIAEVLQIIGGIECRNGTSCPDQLASAIKEAMAGRLAPADSFRLFNDPSNRQRVGLVGDLAGNADGLNKKLDHMFTAGAEVIYCLGNLTGDSARNEIKKVKKLIRDPRVLAIQGEDDWNFAGHKDELKVQDWLIQRPQVLTFQLGSKKGMAFFGDYILRLPGFSDFEPFALEMNMVCNLTNFMQDNSVFPALEAMTPQFQGDIVIFSQIKRWGHWHVGGKDFISVGPAADPKGLCWGLLECVDDVVQFRIERVTPSLEGK